MPADMAMAGRPARLPSPSAIGFASGECRAGPREVDVQSRWRTGVSRWRAGGKGKSRKNPKNLVNPV